MKPAKLNIRVPWYSTQEVAEAWGCTPENLHVLATAGELELTPWIVDGVERIGITADERRRVEGLHAEDSPREHPGKIKTLEFILGMLLTSYTGEDESKLSSPYTLRGFIVDDAVESGIISAPEGDGKKVYRTDESDIAAIRGAMTTFRQSGLYRPKALRDRERAMIEAREAEAMRQQQTAERIITLRADRDEAA